LDATKLSKTLNIVVVVNALSIALRSVNAQIGLGIKWNVKMLCNNKFTPVPKSKWDTLKALYNFSLKSL
jgi:hypothetical protein